MWIWGTQFFFRGRNNISCLAPPRASKICFYIDLVLLCFELHSVFWYQSCSLCLVVVNLRCRAVRAQVRRYEGYCPNESQQGVIHSIKAKVQVDEDAGRDCRRRLLHELVLFHSAIWTIGQWIDPLANGALFTVGTIHSAITHRPTLARTIHQSVHCVLHICTVKYGKIYAVLTTSTSRISAVARKNL